MRGDDENVIDINEKVDGPCGVRKKKQRGIELGGEKTDRKEIGGKFGVPGARSLLEAVERLSEKTDMMRMMSIDEA